MKKKLTIHLAAALLIAGSLTATGAPAHAAVCTATVATWSAYNSNCNYARHWVIANGIRRVAPSVGPQSTSYQPVCYPGLQSYGVEKGYRVNYL